MRVLIVCSAVLVASLFFGPVGASTTTGVKAAAPPTPVLTPAAQVVTAPAAAEEGEILQSMPMTDGFLYTDVEPEMGNCVACDPGKSKGVCSGKTSCSGSASDCRKRGCRVRGTTSKCSNSC